MTDPGHPVSFMAVWGSALYNYYTTQTLLHLLTCDILHYETLIHSRICMLGKCVRLFIICSMYVLFQSWHCFQTSTLSQFWTAFPEVKRRRVSLSVRSSWSSCKSRSCSFLSSRRRSSRRRRREPSNRQRKSKCSKPSSSSNRPSNSQQLHLQDQELSSPAPLSRTCRLRVW